MYTPEDTIGSTKEESIAKAIELLRENQPEKAPLVRPDIPTLKILISFVLWGLITAAISLSCFHAAEFLHYPAYILHPIAAVWWILLSVFKAKAFVRNTVLLYQKYAPEKMRRSCLFVPSCSEYMLLAVDKYGVFIGVCKGIWRVMRCHPPNGGEDYP